MANQDKANRAALILPVDSPPEIVAATQIVIFLVRGIGRTEMDLLEESELRASGGPRATGRFALLVGVTPRARVRESLSSSALEQVIRARVEREYARQGITPVEYDLQIL
jgi:hypothetical protein